jgi:hypothetical protein
MDFIKEICSILGFYFNILFKVYAVVAIAVGAWVIFSIFAEEFGIGGIFTFIIGATLVAVILVKIISFLL